MTVAVTGANGVVGSAIVRKLLDNNIRVRCIVRSPATIKVKADVVEADILDIAGLVKAIDGVDAVVHAAGFVSFNPRNKRQLFDINVQGTRNIVNACLAQGTKKLIHISSVAALGSPSRGASAEQGRHRTASTINEDTRWISGMPVSDYAHSKYLSELEVYRGMEEGLNVSLVNPSLVLSAGDGMRSSSQLFGYVWRQRKFFTDFILNYVDARDVGEIIVRLLSRDHNGERFIASGGSVPISKVFQEIGRRFQKRAPSINVSPALAGAVALLEEFRATISGTEPAVTRQSVRILREDLVFENEKAKRILGIEFQPLESTLDWCCSEYSQLSGASSHAGHG